jgi:hypothetical protein
VKEEYLSIKGALLSVFVEMLKLVGHSPKTIEEQIDSKTLLKVARNSAKIARENAQRIVSTPKSRANIKEALKIKLKEEKDLDISLAIESQIRQKAFSLAVDNLLLARVVSESEEFDKLNEWEGTIVEDLYKILRDNLIEAAYDIIHSETESLEEEVEVDQWTRAIVEDAKHILSLGDEVDLNEALTDREKTFLFGNIQRMFGDCAKKCGRITIRSKANSCKDMCIAKRDAAIKAARAKAKAAKAKAKGKDAKAAKYAQKAKDIEGYAK